MRNVRSVVAADDELTDEQIAHNLAWRRAFVVRTTLSLIFCFVRLFLFFPSLFMLWNTTNDSETSVWQLTFAIDK